MALITSFLFHFTLFRRTRKIASRNVGGPFPKFIPRYSLNISESSPWVWCADVISWLLLHTLTAVGGEFTNHHRHIFICIGQCLNVFSIKRDQMIRKSTRLFRTKKRKTNLNWLSVCDYSETSVNYYELLTVTYTLVATFVDTRYMLSSCDSPSRFV